jgi:lysophospholipase L1-like esterase
MRKIIDKNRIQFTCIIAGNIILALFFAVVCYLANFSKIALPELQIIYPRFYKPIYFLAHNKDYLFLVGFILCIVINGFFIFKAVRYYNKEKESILALSVLIITLLIAEVVLRMLNFQPGRHTYTRYFSTVDSLYSLNGFETDSIGILKISSEAKNEIEQTIKLRKNDIILKPKIYEVYTIAADNIDVINGSIDNEISRYYKLLQSKDTSELDEFENAVIDYIHSPINDDGFRSICFKKYSSEKPKILLLGDSFTWGHSTTNKTSSFADILLSQGYVVYNTGISATDVAQYLAIARKYIPILKPDIVIVNFYLGNDITYYERKIIPYASVFFPTNAGYLMSCPHAKYFESPKATYDFYLRQWEIPKDENIFNHIMAQTVITTLAMKPLYRLKLAQYGDSVVADYYTQAEKRKYAKPYCNVEINEIKTIAEQNGSRFILSSIPEVYTFTFNTKKDFPDLFEGLDFVEMPVTRNDYKLDDGHFNDDGHKKYAAFLDSIISRNE